jgi:hypothetical protein
VSRLVRVSAWTVVGVLSLGWVSVLRVLMIAAGFHRLKRRCPELFDGPTARRAIEAALDRDGGPVV